MFKDALCMVDFFVSYLKYVWTRAIIKGCWEWKICLRPSCFNIFLFFLAFDFCRFCVVIRFFIPATTANELRLRMIFYPRFYPLHLFFLSWFLRKSQYFPFWIFSAKQGHYWYHFYNVFGMTRSLTGDWTRDFPHSKLALYH